MSTPKDNTEQKSKTGKDWNSLAVSPAEGDDFSPAKDQQKDGLDGQDNPGIEPLLPRAGK
ncbi:MAG: hypothetical protein JWM96_65 [Alphaproteobacteria bacterium]|nr:hypothetical protein [Alphaproteobacteria bacterium]